MKAGRVLLMGLLGGSVFLASRINASPIYLPVSIIMGLFAIVLATQFQNMSLQFAGLEAVAQYTSKFPLTEAMAIHFNKLIAVAWILIVAVMYKTNSPGGAANPIRR